MKKNIIEKIAEDTKYIRQKIKENKVSEIKTERPDIWSRLSYPLKLK